MKKKNKEELENIAAKIRLGILEEVYQAQSGHPGGSLSIADLLAVLYFYEMKIDENNPEMETRDRFVLSKGHASPALYATLAIRGFFDPKELKTFRNIHSNLQGHPDKNKVKGVDMSTGSLGQGLSVANGMALSAKLHHQDYRVYCVLGDGELEEGQVWEAAMTAGHYHLDNLCVIVDNNNLQIDGQVDQVMNVHPIDRKFQSFGFKTITIDGNQIESIIGALEQAKKVKDRPTMILAKTIKGKGVSYMENKAEWHGKAPNKEEYERAVNEIKNRMK